MNKLQILKQARTLADLAVPLGFTPAGLGYVLYRLDEEKKYRSFTIPKKAGGTRTIRAPTAQLSLLQGRLSDLLAECVQERKRSEQRYWFASHGFHPGRGIISNAECHRRRRFVFNIDLEDFFGSINFGRVRGFFIRDRVFNLDPKVATILAQIACHKNSLPQGSPCSPIISNLVGNILDSRLLALARDARCTYTRYADDITFSTNEKLFPQEIAINPHGATWVIGEKLEATINESGFRVNLKKTRMSLRQSRQTVTGLVVNAKPNIKADYYRAARSMCHSLFRTGLYHLPHVGVDQLTDNVSSLEGVLAHIHFVKSRRDRSSKVNKHAQLAGEFSPPRAPVDLYRRFLQYKYLAALKAPLIVTEGVSDIIYLQCAIRALHKKFPALAIEKNGQVYRNLSFLKPSGISRDILNLGHGTAGQAALISQYTNILRQYVHKPMAHPVIILLDNDVGASNVLKEAGKKAGMAITLATAAPFYHLGENLYLVKVPESATGAPQEIEDLFQPALLATKIDGKLFDRKKDHGDETNYGKVIFAEAVVRKNAGSIDFAGFEGLLKRLEQVLVHFGSLSGVSAMSAGAVHHGKAAP